MSFAVATKNSDALLEQICNDYGCVSASIDDSLKVDGYVCIMKNPFLHVCPASSWDNDDYDEDEQPVASAWKSAPASTARSLLLQALCEEQELQLATQTSHDYLYTSSVYFDVSREAYLGAEDKAEANILQFATMVRMSPFIGEK